MSILSSRRVLRTCLISLGLWAASAQPAADLITLQGGQLSADITDSNLREDKHVLRGNVRISQGAMSIEADQATASALQTGNSRWTFERSVHIQTEEADLKSNTASAAFSNGNLSTARAEGTPALFEQRGIADKQVRGRASLIEYDLAAGIIKLSGQVWFNNGQNEFRSDTIVYYLREERVVAGEKRGGVNITIRPQKRAGGGSNPDSGPPATGNESGE